MARRTHARPPAPDNKTRDKAVKVVAKYLSLRADPSMQDFLKLWKALFFCMWHSDKPLVQHELAARLARLVHAPPTFEVSELFLHAFWQTMAREWHGIDHHRLNKFLTLIRRVCFESFALLREHGWAEERVLAIARVFEQCPLSAAIGASQPGIRTHVCDVFVPELSRAGCASAHVTHALLEPFVVALGRARERPLIDRLGDSVFAALVEPQPDPLRPDEGAEDEADARAPPFHAHLLAARLFAIASDPETAPYNRDAAHSIRSLFAPGADSGAAVHAGAARRVGAHAAAGGLASLHATLAGLVRDKKAKERKRNRDPPSNEMKLQVTAHDGTDRRVSAQQAASLVKRSRHAKGELDAALTELRAHARAQPAEPAAEPRPDEREPAGGRVANGGSPKCDPAGPAVARAAPADEGAEDGATAGIAPRQQADRGAKGRDGKLAAEKTGKHAKAGRAEMPEDSAAAERERADKRTPDPPARRRSVSFSPALEDVREYEAARSERMTPMHIVRMIQQRQSPPPSRPQHRRQSPQGRVSTPRGRGSPAKARSPIGTRSQRRR
mgnify:CR=1 FL=1